MFIPPTYNFSQQFNDSKKNLLARVDQTHYDVLFSKEQIILICTGMHNMNE